MNSRKRPASQSGSSTPSASNVTLPEAELTGPNEGQFSRIPITSSPPTSTLSHRRLSDGKQNGGRKRQAQGQSSSPQSYVHLEDSIEESRFPDPNPVIGTTSVPLEQQQQQQIGGGGTTENAIQSNSDSIQSKSKAETQSNIPILSSSKSFKSSNSSNSFVLPGAPQSARYPQPGINSTNITSPSSKHSRGAAISPSESRPSTTTNVGATSPGPSGLGRSGSISNPTNTTGNVTMQPALGERGNSGSGSGSGSSGADRTSNASSGQQNARGFSGGGGPTSGGNVRPPSRFANYSDSIIHARQYSTYNTMDLDESLRALYFAPVPIVVIDHTRTIKMLNKPAEMILGISDSTSIGQRLEKFVIPSQRQHYNLALNEAAENLGTALRSALPFSTQLTMQSIDEGPTVTADVNISAWFSTDPIFSAAQHSSGQLASSESSPSNYQSPSSPFGATPTTSASRSGGVQQLNTLPVHEAMFTLTVLPIKKQVRRDSPSSAHHNVVQHLKASIVDHIDKAVLCVSKDAKIVLQNAACKQLLSIFGSHLGFKTEKDEMSLPNEDVMMETEGGLEDFKLISDFMTVWDDKFEKPFPENDWPIYRCAVLGQPTPVINVGLEHKVTKERLICQIDGKPLRDREGFGEHIGGMVVIRNITAETIKFRQESQKEGDLYFKQTCDAMPQLVWVASPTGFVEWYSKSWYDYTGTQEGDSKGVGWQTSIHEEDFPEAANRWSYSLRTGELYETAYRIKRGDGVWRWFLGRALPLRDTENGNMIKWFGTCTDIHDQIEALANSRRAQTQLENVINHAAMTIWATDREGRITVAEGPGVRQLKLMAPGTPVSSDRGGGDRGGGGILRSMEEGSDDADNGGHPRSNSNSNSHSQAQSKQNMIGRSIYTIWDPNLIGKSMERALQGETVVEEMEMDGRWFRTSYTPMYAEDTAANMLNDDGEFDEQIERTKEDIIGVVGASLDITDRKRAQAKVEESLMEKTRALAAEGAAREASRLKSEFLANMSHEIRTPIAGVIGLSELLLDEKGLSPQQRDYAETIQRSAEGLLTVINDVLDFSKVEIGKLDVENAPFNLEVLLRDAKRMLSFATQKKSLEFREAVALTYKGQVLGDVGRLRQVITNLLTNAIKFTAHGFISLEVTELAEDMENLIVKFDVRDSGCGIKPDTLSRLFQPFSQADPSTARRFGGTGLGLSISKNLVELMNGKIGLDSIEGEGSHAWFVIPFRKASEIERAAAIAAKADEAADMLTTTNAPSNNFVMGASEAEKSTTLIRPRKDIWILIAEDNLVNAQIASKNIKKMGFSCRTAENGIKAMEELEKNTYDAILMDCQMPECDGYEATRMIRKSVNPDIRLLPIIALTASAIKGDRERALDAGMVDYLSKPVKRPALEATLCKWLFDPDARQSLSQFMSPSIDTIRAANSIHSIRNPLPSASTMSHQSANEYPFPDLTNPSVQSVSFAIPATEAVSPATHNRFANVRLSPPSEAVIERLKTPDEQLGAEALQLFRSGDALSAAAVLLSARRSSAEEVERLRKEAKEKRPSSSPRSFSYHGKDQQTILPPSSSNIVPEQQGKGTTTTIPNQRVTFAEGVIPERTISADGKPIYRNPFPLFRRSSREQGGMGRDLDGEMMMATMEGQPALNEAMNSGDDVSMQSTPKSDSTISKQSKSSPQ